MSTRAHLSSTPASLWWALASFLGLAKLAVFVLDSNPQFVLGDSMSYLTTAMLGWIPPDRSFVYGFLVYNVTTRARSLSSLVAVQTCAGIVTALVTALILVRFFRAPFFIAAAMAVAVAIEPQQLLYERFVMTESVSTAFFAVFLLLVLKYLHSRKMWVLIAVQVAGVVLIAFRLTYVPLVAATTLIGPFMAYLPVRNRVQLAVHLLMSVSLFVGLHTAYKYWNGYLSKLPAAYLYADGYFLIATVSPLVTPADTDVPELVPVLSRPLAYASGPNQIISRKAELYLAEGLVARLKEALKDDYQVNVEAKRIAYRVIRRDPFGCIRLAVQTYLLFYSREYMSESMRQEAGMRELEPGQLKILSNYHLDARGLPFMKSLTRQYYLASWPFFLLLLHTPVALLLAAALVRPGKRRLLWFLVLITGLQVATVQMLEVEPSTRYLHPVTVPFVIAIGVCATRLFRSHVPSGDYVE